MSIQISNQARAYMRRKQIQKQNALQILSGGTNRRKNTSIVNYSGSKAGKLCVSGKVQSALSMNMYDARGKYTHTSGFTGIFHYDVYMYEKNGQRYIGGSGDDGGMLIEDSRLDYFNKNMGNPWKMLDDFNFAEGVKLFHYAESDKSGGMLTFRYKGGSQVIPASALPKLHPGDYPALKAKDNVLMLQSRSYYRFSTGSEDLVWAVGEGGQMREIITNNWLYSENMNDNQFSYKAGRLLNQLKKGNLWMSQSGENGTISYNESKKIMAAVGIKEGKFSIGVDGEARDYYLCSSGCIVDAESMERWVDVYNSCDYFAKGYKEGDMVKVTDNLQLPVDKDGHVHTSAEELGRYW